MRYALYDFDTKTFVTTATFGSREEAEDNRDSRMNDVIVLELDVGEDDEDDEVYDEEPDGLRDYT